MNTPDDRTIAHEVLTAIRQITRRIAEHSKYLSREAGLTVPQLMSLKAIAELNRDTDEVTVAAVAERIRLSAATTSRVIDRLTRAGLVARERRSTDRRRVCLSLTDAGEDRYATLPTPLQETFVARLGALPEDERTELLSALHRIVQMMDASELDAAPMLVPGADVKSGPVPSSGSGG